ncbi:hypothetical protein T07_236 [Trichinella nelsoni]|uniref:Uncharacterized protein n=1 Tax=Trichinella nelsoni TaxID=6336 RepID=A0A0V0SN97_9BILA|nr:hypothetical protein T07_236 [Trichinella nelsoni]
MARSLMCKRSLAVPRFGVLLPLVCQKNLSSRTADTRDWPKPTAGVKEMNINCLYHLAIAYCTIFDSQVPSESFLPVGCQVVV